MYFPISCCFQFSHLNLILTDTKTLIHILTTHTPTQTTQLSHAYKATYGKNLSDEMKSLHGDFGRLCRGIVLGGPKFDAMVIKGAVSGMGTDEEVLIEVRVYFLMVFGF